MDFNSMQYALYFVLVCAIYYILPCKVRYIWLLGASYYFYMCWNAKYALLILLVTAVNYGAGLLIEKGIKKKLFLVGAIVVSFGLLFYFKYFNFLIENLNHVFAVVGGFRLSLIDVILPVGISFYIFQAVGYTIDVYRNQVQAEKNPLMFALFVSFFPQLVAGPIERTGHLMAQLKAPKKLNAQDLRSGLLYILWGLWMKLVIADHIANAIDPVFRFYETCNGVQLLLATVLFAVQIYCDFGGYSTIAIGSAKILGVDLCQNFRSPYMAINVADFWSRWHISLTSWFRDYVYIPLGGNRKGTVRTYVNIMIIFLLSGLWHGAAWHFVVWGGINGLLMVISRMYLKKHSMKELSTSDKWAYRIVTFMLVDFSWLFFRAGSLGDAFGIIRTGLSSTGLIHAVTGKALDVFGEPFELFILFVSILMLMLADILREKYKDLAGAVLQLRVHYRWAIYLILMIMIIFFGAYGEGYEQTEFIYFQF